MLGLVAAFVTGVVFALQIFLTGRLRSHPIGKGGKLPARHRWLTAPIYRSFLDPDGRPLDMRLRRTY